jgi:hypothetical protein
MSNKEKKNIFQTISNILTNVVFYNFYSGAEKDFRQNKFSTITESYKNVLTTIYYALGDVNDGNYLTLLKLIISGLESTGVHYQTPYSFIQDLSGYLIPRQFHSMYDKKQRETIVRTFITRVMFDTIHHCGNAFLPKIIDDRNKLEKSGYKESMSQSILQFIETHKNEIYNSCIDKTAKQSPAQYSIIVENLKKKNTELQTKLEATEVALRRTSELLKQQADKSNQSNLAIIEFGQKIDEMEETIRRLELEKRQYRNTHVMPPVPHVSQMSPVVSQMSPVVSQMSQMSQPSQPSHVSQMSHPSPVSQMSQMSQPSQMSQTLPDTSMPTEVVEDSDDDYDTPETRVTPPPLNTNVDHGYVEIDDWNQY